MIEKYIGAAACTVGLTIGQVLFKMCAARMSEVKTVFDFGFAAMLLAALSLYGLVSIGWVFLLRGAELSKLYPIMALSFVLVPIASAFVFKDELNAQYGLGVVLIVLGVVLASTSGRPAG